MTSFSSKIFEVFKNLKSDAVPKAPRRPAKSKITIEDVTEEDWANNENVNTSNEQEGIPEEPEVLEGRGKQKKNKDKNLKTESEEDLPVSNNSVHVQATGNVVNIVGSKGVHIGSTYHFQTSNQQQKSESQSKGKINKTKEIENVMKAPMRVSHQYIDFVSRNLGLEWQGFFRKLNYSQGCIETFILDAGPSGVKEARYQLLLDWSRNDKVGTLGKLASLLWEAEEKEVVQGLALIYKDHKDTK